MWFSCDCRTHAETYRYSFSHHPTCVVTAITKNLCKRQAAVDKEVCGGFDSMCWVLFLPRIAVQ